MFNPKNAFGFYFSGANARFEPVCVPVCRITGRQRTGRPKRRKRWLDKTEHTVLSIWPEPAPEGFHQGIAFVKKEVKVKGDGSIK